MLLFLLFLLITFCKFTTNQDARRVRLIDSLIVFKTNILQVSPVKLPVKLQRHFFTHVDPYVAVPFCVHERSIQHVASIYSDVAS